MKIIICGSGIAGLSTYLHLLKHLPNLHTHTITIYESHRPSSGSSNQLSEPSSHTLEALSASTTLVGGGLGVSPNGMRVLLDLDKALHDAVAAQGFRAEHFIFKAANGWTLGKQWTGDGNVRKEGDQEEVCIASSRHGLWRALLEHVGEGVVKYRKIVNVERREDGRIEVRLVDGEGNEEVDDADLLVGADGVKSVVRGALFGADKFAPTYIGQSGVGGFLSQPIPDYLSTNKAMVFTFGGNGFFGYSPAAPISAQSLMWWSTFETPSLPLAADLDPATIKTALLNRHKHWKDPIVQDIIKNAEVQSIYPTWVLPELPHWGENNMVLVGDAAHAMDPTTGQGASQALEDSQTLALALAEFLKSADQSRSQERENIASAIKLYHKIRSPRVREIVERGKKIAGSKASVNIALEYTMYLFLWLMMRFPVFGKMMLGDVNRKLYAWSAEEEIKRELQAQQSLDPTGS